MSKNLKQFPLEEKEDFLFVLEDLYLGICSNLKRYKRYNNELLDVICENVETKDNKIISKKTVPIDTFNDLNDKIQNVSKNLICYTADDSSDSMSYRMFRRIFLKKNKFNIKLNNDPKLDEIFKELLNLRNWIFHNPQSLLVSKKEVFEKERDKQIEDYLKQFPESLRPHLTPIKDVSLISVCFDKDCTVDFLFSLHLQTSKRIETFETVLKKMEKDYSLILGKEVTVIENNSNRTLDLQDSLLAVANLSMAIQNRKYKGDDDNLYNEITLKDFRYKNLEDSKN